MKASPIMVLNGPSGVGKTTVGRRLAARPPNGIHIPGDSLREFVVTRDEHRPTGMAFRAAAALMEAYAQAGFERIVFDFVFEGPEHLQPLRTALSLALEFTVITLWAGPEVMRARKVALGRGDEHLTGQVGRRYERMRANLAGLGLIVPADGSVDEIVTAIESRRHPAQ
jgi:predicted kinase